MSFSSRTVSSILTIAVLAIVVLLANVFVTAAPQDKWSAPATANSKKNTIQNDASSVQAGEKLYARECLSCHGKKGLGDGPKASDLTKQPGNLTTIDFQNQSDGSLFWKISKGNKPMPAFGTAFSEEERWQVINYLRTLNKSAITKSVR